MGKWKMTLNEFEWALGHISFFHWPRKRHTVLTVRKQRQGPEGYPTILLIPLPGQSGYLLDEN